MKSAYALRACLTLFSSHPLLERLFFASVEFAVLAVLVFGVIRVGRIRSARLAALLWLLVLTKPLVSLAIGSPLPLVRMEVAPAVVAAPTPVDRAAHVDPQTSVARPLTGEAQASRLPADDLDDMAATGIAQSAPETPNPGTTNTAMTTPTDSAPAPPAQSVGSSRPWNPAAILLTIWLTGTAGFAGLSLLDRVRVLRLVRGAQLPEASLSARYQAVVSELGLKRPVRLRITTALEGPALVGSVFPTILIPAWLADDSNHARLDWALRHELMHWKLLDPFASLVRELAQILFYFHPAAWWAGRQWEISAERACDRAIVTNDLDSRDYAEQLYGILVGMQGRLRARIGNGLFATRTQIGQRIAALLNGPRTPHPHLSALALVVVTLVAAVTLSIGGAFADKHLKGHDSEKPDDSPNTTALAAAEQPPDKPAEKPADASPAVAPSQSASGASASGASAAGSSAAEPKPANTSDAAFTYAGTVVDDHGKPVAGAKLAFDYWHLTYPADGLPVLAVSDSQGRFQFSRRKSDFSDAGSTGPWWFLAMIVATKEGYGLAGGRSIQFETTGKLAEEQHQPPGPRPKDWTNVLKLAADDVPIHGRILDTEGRPVAGARVQAINAWAGRDGTLESWERVAQEPKAGNWRPLAKLRALNFSFAPFVPRPALVPAVRTDATGWFTLKGVGRERVVDIAVSGPGIETLLLHVRTRRGTVIKVPSPYQFRDPRFDSYYPCEFTHVAGPSIPVEGHVTDAKSKRPLAHVMVRADRIGADPLTGGLPARQISTTTAADGSYRLQGLPLGLNRLGVVSSIGSHYLPAGLDVTTRRGDTRLVADIPLMAGILVRGRVTDSRTGMRVSGSVEYFAFLTNPHLDEAQGFEKSETFGEVFQHRTNENGLFEIPVLPGQGILAFRADNFQAFPLGVGADRIDGAKEQTPSFTSFVTAPSYCATEHYHLLTPLDPQPGAGVLTLGLTLRSGVTVKGKVLAADGKPLSDYCIVGETRFMSWSRNKGEAFTFEGYEPTEHRRLMFYHPGRNLVGLYELTGEPPAELEIKLHSGATITGRVVDAAGRPLENLEIDDAPLQTISPDNRAEETARGILLDKYLQEQMQGARFATDKQGRFKLRGIIPGLKYSGVIFYTGGPWGRYPVPMFTDVTAKEGETKDLGDLPFKPPGPHAKAEPPKAKTENADVNLIRGRVLLPDGKPAAGARVLAMRRYWSPSVKRTPLAKTVAGSAGAFTIAIPRNLPYDGIGTGSAFAWIGAEVDGFGTGYQHWDSRDTPAKELEIKLLPEVPIHGRIVDLEGKPVAGVHVAVDWQASPREEFGRWLESPREGNLTEMIRMGGYGELQGYEDDSKPPVVTDRDGRFTLSGIGADRVARLAVHGELIADAAINVIARAIEPITMREGLGQVFGADFTYQAEPTRPIVGTVRDAATGMPLTGVSVQEPNGPVHSQTDSQGTYRLVGLPKSRLKRRGKSLYEISFLPGPDQPYLALRRLEIVDAPGLGLLTLDVKLPRGVWINGRVTEKETGAGAKSMVCYFPALSNPLVTEFPHLAEYRNYMELGWNYTRPDGTFRVVGLPGRGLVAVQGLQKIYLEGVEASRLAELAKNYPKPFYWRGSNMSAIQEIEPAPGAADFTCDLAVSAGGTMRILVADQAGKPVARCHFWYTMAHGGVMHSSTDESPFELRGFEPNESRPIFFQSPKLGKALVIHYDEKSPHSMTVTLEPWMTVKGRFVDEEGAPVKWGHGHVDAEIGPEARVQLNLPVDCDANGRFVFYQIAPGAKSYSISLDGFEGTAKVVPVAGKTVDLGEIKLKPQP